MFYPILLSMMAVAPVGVPANEPDPTIRITLNSEGQYLPGDRAKVQVITRDDGYLVVFRVSPEGKLRVLFPLDPTDDNYVKGGKRYLLLGRGGREGFTVDAGGTGVVFAAVSLDPWRFSAYVQNDHWDFAALNTVTYEDTETDLVNLAQAMASGRFDYDIIGYTVASQQVAAVDEQADAGTGASVGVVDTCFDCYGMSSGVYYGSGYYNNTYGLYDPYYYSPYYNYGPYYPAWGYGPTYGWGWGWGGCYGYYCNGSGYPPYNPPYPTAVPYTPYQKKSWDHTWNGSAPPYRPRGESGYSATNTVSGQLPGIGVQQQARFRDRTSVSNAGGAPAGTSVVKQGTAPVSKTTSGSSTSGSSATGGRRREAAPVISSGGSSSGKAAPMAVPSRPRSASQAAPSATGGTSGRQARPSTSTSTAVTPSATPSGDRRYQMPVEWTRPSPSVSQSPAVAPPVSRQAASATSAAPAGTKATGEGRSSEPVLRRRESDQPATGTEPAPAARQDNNGQSGGTPGRGYSPMPPSQPSPGYSGGGSYSGSGGRSAPSQPSAPPSAVAGGGRRH
jgi:hypothetical protein